MKTEQIYLGDKNTVDLLLKAETSKGILQPYGLSNVTRITLKFGDTLIDSDNDPDAIVWDPAVTEVEGKIILALGEESIPTGQYDEVILRLYENSETKAIRWGTFKAEVIASGN